MATPPFRSSRTLKRVLGVREVFLFCIVAVFGLRGLATAAKMGPGVLIVWLLVIAVFFIPLCLVISELGTRDPGEGGFYRWARDAFGPMHGFLAGWFYWVSNVSGLPALLVFLAGNAVYAIRRPDLGEHQGYIVISSLLILAASAWANVRGLEAGRRIINVGGMASWLAGALIIVASAVAVMHYGSATSWTWAAMSTGLDDWRTFGYFGTLAFALTGPELIACIGGEVKEPKRTLPRAMLMTAVTVSLLYTAGTAAVLAAVPPAEISPVSGAIGAMQAVANRSGWSALPVIGAVLVVLATGAGAYIWLGGIARLPFAAGLDHFIPAAFARTHPKYGTPHVAIWSQAVVCMLFVIGTQLGSTVREGFLIVLDMTIVLTFIPFFYIFLSVPRLRPAGAEAGVSRIPGGRIGLWFVTIAGTLTTLVAIISAMIPPPGVDPVTFEAKLWGGLILFGVTGLTIFRRFAR